jgi:Multimeric flavodoxin WrbA
MKIVIINGSPRQNGNTAMLLNSMQSYLLRKADVEVTYYHLDSMDIRSCQGCCQCYKTGSCIMNDDAEKLSQEIFQANGIILGSPTYASSISGQLKTFIDRGHFVIEQLLYNKYSIAVVTGENYGSETALKSLKNLILYSGGFITKALTFKFPFQNHPILDHKLDKKLALLIEKMYTDIHKQRIKYLQRLQNKLIFHLGILPFVRKKGTAYEGIFKYWKFYKSP